MIYPEPHQCLTQKTADLFKKLDLYVEESKQLPMLKDSPSLKKVLKSRFIISSRKILTN